MKNLEIDQSVICDYCEKNHNTNRSRCEGSHCVESKNDYFEDYGINEIDIKEDSIQNLKVGETIFVIKNKIIGKTAIEAFNTDRNGIRIITDDNSCFDIPNNQCRKNYFCGKERIFFIKKEDAVKKYKEIISEKMFAMMEMLNKI